MSTSEQVIKQFINATSKRYWTDAQILALTPKMRAELSKYAEKDGKPVSKISPELATLIQQRGFSAADGRAALTMIQDKTINPMTESNTQWILSKGGNEVTTPEKNVLFMLNGERVVRPLTPIPTNPKVEDRYDNLDTLAAFCGTLVSHKDGIWSNASEQALAKMFPTLDSGGLNEVACLVAGLLNEDAEWKAMLLPTKASITGRNMAVFIRSALNNLSRTVYNYLNTKIVIGVFGVIVKAEDGTWEFTQDDEGELRIPSKLYTSLAKTPADIQFSTEYPATMIYRGGWIPRGRLPKVDVDQTSSLLAARQRAVDVVKGDVCMPTLLAKSAGFSGITLEGAKILYFCISATLSAWKRGKVADIRLVRDGDITPLYCSLSYWQQQIKNQFKEEGSEKSDHPYEAMELHTGPWFYFMTAKRNAHLNVPVAIKELITHSHHEGAVAITYLDDTLKTSVDKTSGPVNHDVASATVLPADLPFDFIVKCPIYGTAFFPNDSALTRSQQKGTSKGEVGGQYTRVRVYEHGNAMDFMGIASTLEDLSLVGVENEKKGKETVIKFVPIPLKYFPDRKSWYTRVSTDINSVYQAIFSPKKTYSPISNLLVITKGKVSVLQDLNSENAMSTFAGKVFVKGGFERKKFTPPAPTITAATGEKPVITTTPVTSVVAEKPMEIVVPPSSSSPSAPVEVKAVIQEAAKRVKKVFALPDSLPTPQAVQENEEEGSSGDDETDGEGSDEKGDETADASEAVTEEEDNWVNLNDS